MNLITEYLENWRKLGEVLDKNGENEEAEAIREILDDIYKNMSPEERVKLLGLN